MSSRYLLGKQNSIFKFIINPLFVEVLSKNGKVYFRHFFRNTGIAVQLPVGYVGLLCARSSLGVKFGLSLPNGVGVIDWDYRGQLQVALVNLSQTPYTIAPGERIAQLLVMPVCRAEFVQADSLEDTARGQKGFGSTGRTSLPGDQEES